MLLFIYIQQGKKTQLLHVFQEDFILNNFEKKSLGKDKILLDEGKEEFLCYKKYSVEYVRQLKKIN